MTDIMLSWALVVATLDRIEILEKCVSCALFQSRKPDEIIIVDASREFEAHRERISGLVSRHSINLKYIAASARSLTVQRNQGISASHADILFLIDDDSLMHPGCAEAIMKAYESEFGHAFVALGCGKAKTSPLSEGFSPERKSRGLVRMQSLLRQSAVTRWVEREILMLNTHYSIVPYDSRDRRFIYVGPRNLSEHGIELRRYVSGYQLTARREIALRERFDSALLAYCPAEDVDFCYRMGRWGVIGVVPSAQLFHYEVAAGRLKRYAVSALRLMNPAFFYRRHARSLRGARWRFSIWLTRHTIAEFMKDTLSRRWRYPQFRGAIAAFPYVFRILALQDSETMDDQYRAIQRRFLSIVK